VYFYSGHWCIFTPALTREARRLKRFDRIDADKNGLISQIEWNTKIEKRFAKMDLNKDGFVTQDEWETRRKHYKKKHEAK